MNRLDFSIEGQALTIRLDLQALPRTAAAWHLWQRAMATGDLTATCEGMNLLLQTLAQEGAVRPETVGEQQARAWASILPEAAAALAKKVR